MAEHDSEAYKSWAEAGVAEAVKALTYGRTNRLDLFKFQDGPLSPIAKISGMLYLRGVPQISENHFSVSRRATAARAMEVGNCQESSSIAFDWLARQGRRPIAIAARADRGASHAFVVIGFDRNCPWSNVQSWPDWSWVCDPWVKKVYRTNTLTDFYSYLPVIELRESEAYLPQSKLEQSLNAQYGKR